MARLSAVLTLTTLLTAGAVRADETPSADPVRFRATIDLADGSRLIGTTTDRSLRLALDYAEVSIPLGKIRRWDAIAPKPGGEKDSPGANKITVQFINGDRVTGTLNQSQLQFDTLVGTVTPKLKFVSGVSYVAWREDNMPPGKGDLAFGGRNWLAWRTEFAVEGDRLKSLPKPRPGFQYGHEGHGRGPMLVANLGDSDWRDYSLEARFCATGVDPSFNPYGLGSDYHDGAIVFHVADAKESQNERGNSFYTLSFHGDGTWDLRAVYNHFCNQPIGWGNPTGDADRTLAHGAGLAIDRQNGNHIRIDVLGNRIRAWFDDQTLLDVVDSQMDEAIGGQRLDHGGVGFAGGFDSMFWVKDVIVRSLDSQAKTGNGG